ncbi:hypothetical protein HDU67_001980, partial [Dinochytrium kinnereticum]
TSTPVLIILFFLWGHAQISVAFFFSSIFKQSRVIISLALDQIIGGDATAPLAIFVWPPFAFFRGLTILNISSHRPGYRAYTLSRFLSPTDEVLTCCIALLIGSIFYLLMGGYLSTILSSGSEGLGAPSPWHWPITHLLHHLNQKDRWSASTSHDVEAGGRDDADDDLEEEDDDVRVERDRVTSNAFPGDCPLVVKGMRKIYSLDGRRRRSGRGSEGRMGPKVAVRDFSLAVERGVVFGLLGPNGAGKTTLISILTGVSSPSAGTARLAGYDLDREKEMVHRSIGVCPQHDILWDDLTVKEHLLFYARLKGIPPIEEASAALQAMESVALQTFADRLSKGLSGGEKRRLSIAIALVGNPGVVFLDEPT